MLTHSKTTVTKLASRFSWMLTEELGVETRKAIAAENARRSEPSRADSSCASHDHCDANEVMAAAFKSALGTKVNVGNATHTAIWNDAWDLAKDFGFDAQAMNAVLGTP